MADNTSDGLNRDGILHSLYYNPNGPAAFSSVDKLFNEARKKIPKITHTDVKEWLKSQLTYTLHKPARRNFLRNRMIVSKIDEEWEADLVEMQDFASENNGYRYLLTVIDIFSKFAWVIPLKSKTGKLVTEAFVEIFRNRKPASIRTDKGKEFINRDFQNLLKSEQIRYYNCNNTTIKCAVVERFNRTFKNRMFRYFTSIGKHKYIHKLGELLEGYNKSYHRSIRMAPIEVKEENSSIVFKNLYGKDNLRDLVLSHKPTTKLQVGDEVRLKYKLGPFDKAFYPTWTDRVYKIKGVDRSKRIAVHTVEGEDQQAQKFYPHEVQHVNAEVYRIEKILKRRRYKGRIQYFVKWLNYPSTFNSWIDSADLSRIQ